jgi:potassium-dependent mechanosensitive channel
VGKLGLGPGRTRRRFDLNQWAVAKNQNRFLMHIKMPAFNKLTLDPVFRWKNYFLVLIYCLLSLFAKTQNSDTTVPAKIMDTVDRTKIMRDISIQEAQKNMQAYKSGRISMHQDLIFDNIRKANQLLKIYLKNGIDTVALNQQLALTNQTLAVAREGVFINKGTSQSQRNLSVSASIVNYMLNILAQQKKTLDDYASGLIRFRYQLDSLYSDTTIYLIPSDSVEQNKYLERVSLITAEIGTVDSNLIKSISSVQQLQFRVDVMLNQLQLDLGEIDLYIKNALTGITNREYANIWSDTGYAVSFRQIIRFSIVKAKLAFSFYVRDNLGLIVIMFISLSICFVFLRSMKRELTQGKMLDPLSGGQIVFSHPVLSAIIIVFGIFQFLFPDQPFIFSFCLWIISIFSLTIIFIKWLSPHRLRYWFIMAALFILAGMDNMIIEASELERWGMLVLSLAGIADSLRILFNKQKRKSREKTIIYIIVFIIISQTLSIMLNIYGRYNLSKSLLIGGYSGVMIAVLLFWIAKFVNQGLALGSKIYKSPDGDLSNIIIEKDVERFPTSVYFILIVGWLFLVGKIFYVFKLIFQPLSDFFTNEHSLGAYSFSVSSIFLFIIILFCSFFLSSIISFFTSDSGLASGLNKKPSRSGLGSWMLLIRIFVICVGIFLAFAAAGIPLDRITIIFGALGVGIGLGLQGLVNNLVSGLIIAFEKPVKVGDIIELNGGIATMKSIGFRSSIITMADGASVIIPNGDLLSAHLVNWSMSRQVKRNSVIVGVASNTNIVKANQLLTEILKNNHNILQHPTPTVMAKEFNQNSIDLELLFWVKSNWDMTKSEVISEIETLFAKEGIAFPIAQQ